MSSAVLTVSLFNFLLKFCGVCPILRANSATLIPFSLHKFFIKFEVFIISPFPVETQSPEDTKTLEYIINQMVDIFNIYTMVFTVSSQP